MALKSLFNVIKSGTLLMGKAFVRTMREEIAEASRQQSIRINSNQTNRLINQNEISVDEAKRILNVNTLTKPEIEERYKFLFAANGNDKGKSFYLQSKIVRAKERLEKEMK